MAKAIVKSFREQVGKNNFALVVKRLQNFPSGWLAVLHSVCIHLWKWPDAKSSNELDLDLTGGSAYTGFLVQM